MDFRDSILQFAPSPPFIQLLGYDVFNPFEVNPKFIADIGIKKGEKVDYAIMREGKPILLIECKHYSENLDPHNSQLFRYFHTTEAKFGLLTNGITFRFYTDLVTPFTTITKKAFNLIVSDLINDRLKSALKTETAEAEPLTGEQEEQDVKVENGIETTQEEAEAYLIIKSILRQKIDPQRIHLRDAQSYCAILFDDNNRKPICRLYFNGKKKFVEIPDENKKFSKHEIQVLYDIFGLGDKLMEVVEGYERSRRRMIWRCNLIESIALC
ncbi:type I restriction and modification enzyme subunit R-like protein [Arcticibacter tournemirensis]|uniref:Restriction endonuclease type I HsdR N-terminal domain-containing protein n=1 Tax=Arcticibacter tournemirensis TaxID=699437 RepID=A0A5M9HG72_9SPHI|nr:type I restriction endonuclease [Arcticibacter tournemirensis]KAA8485395.1 hypothetical protein F1649_04570 [Arcticibacter tournemirensis]TQM50313.1 type I restriction and modification enzyme subunit R-like protein [Arcticibacter tournemirensis]